MYVIATELLDGTLDYQRAIGSTRKAPLLSACRRLAQAPACDAAAYCIIRLGDGWPDDQVVATFPVKQKPGH